MVNMELLQTYAAETWLTHNQELEVVKAKLEKDLEKLKKEGETVSCRSAIILDDKERTGRGTKSGPGARRAMWREGSPWRKFIFTAMWKGYFCPSADSAYGRAGEPSAQDGAGEDRTQALQSGEALGSRRGALSAVNAAPADACA
jgi:hypothetical protein